MSKMDAENRGSARRRASLVRPALLGVGGGALLLAAVLLRLEYEKPYYYFSVPAERMLASRRLGGILTSKLFTPDARGCTVFVLEAGGVAVLAHSASGEADGPAGIGTGNAVRRMGRLLEQQGRGLDEATAWIEAGRERARKDLLESVEEAGVAEVVLANANPSEQADSHRRDALFDPGRRMLYVQHHIMAFHDRDRRPAHALPEEAVRIEHRKRAARLASPQVSDKLLAAKVPPDEGVLVLDLGREAVMSAFGQGDEARAVERALRAAEEAAEPLEPFALFEAPSESSLARMSQALEERSVEAVWRRCRRPEPERAEEAVFYHSGSNRLTFRYSAR